MTRPFTAFATGDLHWSTRSRFEECQRVHNTMAEHVERDEPDAVLCGGDVYDRASNPDELPDQPVVL